MIKFFCDNCNEEITDKNHVTDQAPGGNTFTQIKTKKMGTLSIKILHEWQEANPPGHICIHCIFDAIRKLDNRPVLAPPPRAA